ncbi:MAG: Argininosuccinate lyase [Firmicutes bacterium]|nr:Argininosuccinate lyase [Bacillota bacterium]
MKLWSGRFIKDTSKEMDDFNSSISFDMRLYKQDIMGSMVHAEALFKCGIISLEEKESIRKGLLSILKDIEDGTFEFSVQYEDIHMNIEKALTDRIGEAGKKLHTARSRNDQVALDLRLFLKDEILEVQRKLVVLLDTLVTISEDNLYTIMPGYTHLQPAQPITLAHHLMAYYEMFKRDLDRLKDCYRRTDTNPLGSCALASTTYSIDRELTTKLLGFSNYTMNSLDGVSDRDYAIEFISVSSIIMMHLSRLCEELILWSTNEFGYIEMDDAYSTGSSIMPQKKNPDVAELIRGKTGRVFGNLMALLTVMKGLPLAYNKDMQEDKESLFDTLDTVKACLSIMSPMLSTLKINRDNMQKAANKGFINATDVADYLSKKGVPFRTAHRIVGELVLHCTGKGVSLQDLSLEDFRKASPVFEEDIMDIVTPYSCVVSRNIPGGPAPEQVRLHIDSAKTYIRDTKSFLSQQS